MIKKNKTSTMLLLNYTVVVIIIVVVIFVFVVFVLVFGFLVVVVVVNVNMNHLIGAFSWLIWKTTSMAWRARQAVRKKLLSSQSNGYDTICLVRNPNSVDVLWTNCSESYWTEFQVCFFGNKIKFLCVCECVCVCVYVYINNWLDLLC